MKCFAAVAAGVALGSVAPAMAFVNGGGMIAASSQSRYVLCLRPVVFTLKGVRSYFYILRSRASMFERMQLK